MTFEKQWIFFPLIYVFKLVSTTGCLQTLFSLSFMTSKMTEEKVPKADTYWIIDITYNIKEWNTKYSSQKSYVLKFNNVEKNYRIWKRRSKRCVVSIKLTTAESIDLILIYCKIFVADNIWTIQMSLLRCGKNNCNW